MGPETWVQLLEIEPQDSLGQAPAITLAVPPDIPHTPVHQEVFRPQPMLAHTIQIWPINLILELILTYQILATDMAPQLTEAFSVVLELTQPLVQAPPRTPLGPITAIWRINSILASMQISTGPKLLVATKPTHLL